MYLRRFQFRLELKMPPPTMRESIIRKHPEGLEASGAFTTKLAAHKTLMPAQIDFTVRSTCLTQSAMEEPVESLIRRQLDHADQAMDLRPEMQARRVVTKYKLDYLNPETRFSVERIIEALRAWRRGTLCFYGPPGTGKTALAEYIAA